MPRNTQEEKLLDLVRERPILYDKKHPDYKNRDTKENAWKKIGEIMGYEMTGDQCQKCWINLKNQYMAYQRKLVKPTGSAAGSIPYFRYAKEMEFCKHSGFQNESTYSNIDVSQSYANNSMDVETITADEPTSEHPTDCPDLHVSTKNMKKQLDTFEEKILEVFKKSSEEKNEDEYDRFINSLAPKIRRIANMDLRKAAEVQLDIHKLICEAEIQLLDQESLHN